MSCRINCKCKICGCVRLHVSKTKRQAKRKPVEPATLALMDAMRAVTKPNGSAK